MPDKRASRIESENDGDTATATTADDDEGRKEKNTRGECEHGRRRGALFSCTNAMHPQRMKWAAGSGHRAPDQGQTLDTAAWGEWAPWSVVGRAGGLPQPASLLAGWLGWPWFVGVARWTLIHISHQRTHHHKHTHSADHHGPPL